MKQIKAVIRPEKLTDVKDALEKVPGYTGIMVTEIMGHGNQKGIDQTWRGEKYKLDLIPKVMLDIVVKDEYVEGIKKAILSSAPIGEIGDGKIFIYDVQSVVRIRTGEEGESAL